MRTHMLCLAILLVSASGRTLRLGGDHQTLSPDNPDAKPVVVTRAFCGSVLASIQSKSLPYWNDETQSCNPETRDELIQQCNKIISEFRDQLSKLCPAVKPCDGDGCNKDVFKPVKYMQVPNVKPLPSAPNAAWSAFPKPPAEDASRRMAQAQAANPPSKNCDVPPCKPAPAAKPVEAVKAPEPAAKPADAAPPPAIAAPPPAKPADAAPPPAIAAPPPAIAAPPPVKPADAAPPPAKPADAKPPEPKLA